MQQAITELSFACFMVEIPERRDIQRTQEVEAESVVVDDEKNIESDGNHRETPVIDAVIADTDQATK